MNETKKPACPKCGGIKIETAHGPYCPDAHCKWGWETEMDGSELKPAEPEIKIADDVLKFMLETWNAPHPFKFKTRQTPEQP